MSAKLQGAFDPIWIDDFGELKDLGAFTFLVRQIIRLKRDPKTSLSNTTATYLRLVTGFDYKTFKKALARLIELGLIVPKSYHIYHVPDFKRTKTLSDKSQTTLGKIPNHFTGKSQTTLRESPKEFTGKSQTPIINTDTDITDRVPVPVLDDEIPSLRTLYDFANRENLKIHLENRGLTGADIAKVFERVYPFQYTGKVA